MFQLHIDSHNDPSSPEFKEVDFFAEHSENAPEPEVEAYPMMEGQKLASVPVPIENGNGSLAKKEGKGILYIFILRTFYGITVV